MEEHLDTETITIPLEEYRRLLRAEHVFTTLRIIRAVADGERHGETEGPWWAVSRLVATELDGVSV